jgi:hypothetical protein
LWYVGHTWDGCSVAYSFCSSIPCLCNVSYKKQKGKKEENSLPQKDQTSWKHTNVCLFHDLTWKHESFDFTNNPFPYIYMCVITFSYNLVRGIQGQV